MNRRFPRLTTLALAAVLAVAVTARGQTADPAVGTWKLNLAKSTYSPGPPPKSPTVRKLEASPGGFFKAVADGVDAQGKPTHNEITFKYDGKDYALKGAASPTTRAYTLKGNTIKFVTKVDGQVTTTVNITFSADGKTETGITTGKDAQGRAVKNVAVWDRQ